MTGQPFDSEDTIQDENTDPRSLWIDPASIRWTRWIRLDRRTMRSCEGNDARPGDGR